MTGRTRPFLLGLLTAALVVALAGAGVVLTGAYDIAASRPHPPLERWALETTMEKSVARQAASLESPPNFMPADLRVGAGEYKAMCQQCHGGPGVGRDAWANGLTPQPPELVQAAEDWSTEEVFWLVKHGVKMTGMPAFGEHHSDEELWKLAAFVKTLPRVTPDAYAESTAAAGHGAARGEAAAGHGHDQEHKHKHQH